MYRTNAQSRALRAFLKAGLPYRLVGAQRFGPGRSASDGIGLRLIHNPSDQVSLRGAQHPRGHWG
jgi:hypothetical protein